MTDSTRSSTGVVTKRAGKSVSEIVEQLTGVIEERGLTLFAVIDHSGQAASVGLQMPDTKLVIFGSPAKGTPVMLASPQAALDLPLKVLVWDDGNGAVSVSYNSPDFLADRYHIEGALRAPFGAVKLLVDAVVGS